MKQRGIKWLTAKSDEQDISIPSAPSLLPSGSSFSFRGMRHNLVGEAAQDKLFCLSLKTL